jgi:hypothetical protein
LFDSNFDKPPPVCPTAPRDPFISEANHPPASLCRHITSFTVKLSHAFTLPFVSISLPPSSQNQQIPPRSSYNPSFQRSSLPSPTLNQLHLYRSPKHSHKPHQIRTQRSSRRSPTPKPRLTSHQPKLFPQKSWLVSRSSSLAPHPIASTPRT